MGEKIGLLGTEPKGTRCAPESIYTYIYISSVTISFTRSLILSLSCLAVYCYGDGLIMTHMWLEVSLSE